VKDLQRVKESVMASNFLNTMMGTTSECGKRTVSYARCDSIKKSWLSFLRLAGIPENKYHLEDTRTTFNSYALSHAEFDRNMACFALGNNEPINKDHYTNIELLNETTSSKIRTQINRLPFEKLQVV